MAERRQDRHNQSFQPEWIATIPPLRRVKSTRAKPACSDHVRKLVGRRKLANRFDEIAIRRAVAGHDLAHRRDGGKRIGVVDLLDHRQIDAREFEAQVMPAALEHPIGFAKRGFDARHVADAERDRIGVEARIWQRQRLGVAFDERQPAGESASCRALRRHAQHVAVDVDDRHRQSAGRPPPPPAWRRRRCRRRRRYGRKDACAKGEPWRRERPSTRGAGRTTSDRSSRHIDRRPCGTRRPPGPVSRPGERCGGRSASHRARRASGLSMKRPKP